MSMSAQDISRWTIARLRAAEALLELDDESMFSTDAARPVLQRVAAQLKWDAGTDITPDAAVLLELGVAVADVADLLLADLDGEGPARALSLIQSTMAVMAMAGRTAIVEEVAS